MNTAIDHQHLTFSCLENEKPAVTSSPLREMNRPVDSLLFRAEFLVDLKKKKKPGTPGHESSVLGWGHPSVLTSCLDTLSSTFETDHWEEKHAFLFIRVLLPASKRLPFFPLGRSVTPQNSHQSHLTRTHLPGICHTGSFGNLIARDGRLPLRYERAVSPWQRSESCKSKDQLIYSVLPFAQCRYLKVVRIKVDLMKSSKNKK